MFIKEKCDIYNNIGCIYRTIGRNKTAVKYLTKSLRLGGIFPETEMDLATTHSNLCAVYSNVN
jgi:hypothetical protein